MKKYLIFLFTTIVCCSLNAQSTFRPSTFTPIYVTPQHSNVSNLERSLQKMEERRNKASEKYSEFMEFLGDIMDNLYQDDETLEWFDNFSTKYVKTIKSDFDNGDYGNVIVNATKFKGEIKLDGELRARIKTKEQYEEAKQIVLSKKNLSDDEKRAWLKKYTYKFIPLKNDQGIVYGARNWMEIGGPDNTAVILP